MWRQFPLVFFSKIMFVLQIGAQRRQTAATATWAAPTPWTGRCCCSTASTTASRGTSSRSTSPRTSHRPRECRTTSPCKWPARKAWSHAPSLRIRGRARGLVMLLDQSHKCRWWQNHDWPRAPLGSCFLIGQQAKLKQCIGQEGTENNNSAFWMFSFLWPVFVVL